MPPWFLTCGSEVGPASGDLIGASIQVRAAAGRQDILGFGQGIRLLARAHIIELARGSPGNFPGSSALGRRRGPGGSLLRLVKFSSTSDYPSGPPWICPGGARNTVTCARQMLQELHQQL